MYKVKVKIDGVEINLPQPLADRLENIKRQGKLDRLIEIIVEGILTNKVILLKDGETVSDYVRKDSVRVDESNSDNLTKVVRDLAESNSKMVDSLSKMMSEMSKGIGTVNVRTEREVMEERREEANIKEQEKKEEEFGGFDVDFSDMDFEVDEDEEENKELDLERVVALNKKMTG